MSIILLDRLTHRAAALFILFILIALPAISQAREPDLRIFFTSDTRGMLRRCGCSQGQLGGLSARASYIKANGLEGRTLVLDAGDTLYDGPTEKKAWADFYKIKAWTMLAAMEESGYAAAVPGEYDFAFGAETLKSTAWAAGFPFVAANVTFMGGPVFRPYFIKEYGKLKAAVVGVVDDAFPYKSFPAFEGLSVANAEESAKKALKDIGKQADIKIVLAHLAVSDPVKFSKSIGADVVIQGHSSEMLEKPVKAGKALLVKGFYKGKEIGRLDLWLSGKRGEKRIKDYKYQVIPLDESIPPDPEVEKLMARYRESLKKKNFAFSEPDPEGKGSFVGAQACKGCHAKEFSNWSATRHARAFSSLIKTNDQYDPECLPCHTTGYGFISGYPAGGESFKDVTCESCHGRGSLHAEGKAKMAKEVKEEVCLSCHDEYNSPNFQYEKYLEMGGAHRGGNSGE